MCVHVCVPVCVCVCEICECVCACVCVCVCVCAYAQNNSSSKCINCKNFLFYIYMYHCMSPLQKFQIIYVFNTHNLQNNAEVS